MYDIVIIGSGIVGSVTAIALAQNTALNIAILDINPITLKKNKILTHRFSALSHASKNILKNIHIWDEIPCEYISVFNNMEVWDKEGQGKLHFDSQSVQESALGYIVEDDVIRQKLWENLRHLNIDMIAPIQLIDMQKKMDYLELITSDARVIKTRLLIGADGANSWVRKTADILLSTRDYQHTAIIATVQTELPHEMTAWQCFSDLGILAFLPLKDLHTCSIVWSVKPMDANNLLLLEPDVFQEKLADAFMNRLGKVTLLSPRYDFKLTMRHAKQYVKDSIALIGDAAHTIHPLAGLGVNMGLLDAAALVEVIMTALQKNRRIDSFATLRRYERMRKGDTQMMLGFVEGIKELFASHHPSLRMLRNSGLNWVEKVAFLKKFFIRYAIWPKLR